MADPEPVFADTDEQTVLLCEAFAQALGANRKAMVRAITRLDVHQKQRLFHAASRLVRATRGSMGAAYRP